MLIGTSMSLSARRCAVTTISSKPLLDAVASPSPFAARAMTGTASCPATAIGHKHRWKVFERIAHPLKLPFPHIQAPGIINILGYPLRIEAGP
jgi:hypothetical protein